MQLIRDGQLVDLLRALRELADRAEDLGVPRAIEVLGRQVLEALSERDLGDEHRAEHRLLGLEVLRRKPAGKAGVLTERGDRHSRARPRYSSSPTGRSRFEPSAGTTIVLTDASTSGKTSISTW